MANNERASQLTRGPLSQDLIVDVAKSLVDRSGIDSLTMRKIADVLGITPMALYRHVKNKNDLLVQLLDRSVSALPKPELPEDPVRRIVVVVKWMHAGLSQHQWVVRLLAEDDLIAPSILWALEEVYAALAEHGLGLAQSADVFRVVWRFVIGDITERVGRQRLRLNGDHDPVRQSMLGGADPDQYPHVAALTAYRRSSAGREDFAEDLDRLVIALVVNA